MFLFLVCIIETYSNFYYRDHSSVTNVLCNSDKSINISITLPLVPFKEILHNILSLKRRFEIQVFKIFCSA